MVISNCTDCIQREFTTKIKSHTMQRMAKTQTAWQMQIYKSNY